MIFHRRTRYLDRRLGLPLTGRLVLVAVALAAVGAALHHIGGF